MLVQESFVRAHGAADVQSGLERLELVQMVRLRCTASRKMREHQQTQSKPLPLIMAELHQSFTATQEETVPNVPNGRRARSTVCVCCLKEIVKAGSQ